MSSAVVNLRGKAKAELPSKKLNIANKSPWAYSRLCGKRHLHPFLSSKNALLDSSEVNTRNNINVIVA